MSSLREYRQRKAFVPVFRRPCTVEMVLSEEVG